jgi:hypothetical protein
LISNSCTLYHHLILSSSSTTIKEALIEVSFPNPFPLRTVGLEKYIYLEKLAARMTSIAIYLVPVYIIVLCVLVNYIVVSTSNIVAPGSTSRFYGSSNLVLRDDHIRIPRLEADLISIYRTSLLRTYRSGHPQPSVVG